MDQVRLLQVHIDRWALNSPLVYLEKIVLDTYGGMKPSYPVLPEMAVYVQTSLIICLNDEFFNKVPCLTGIL
jgi:hypothetical protein